ncbi:hypothetical protein Nepgr_002338 [Nepenthes gracilis]|uniref:non-specific serine/threonine protein kinase n=1 Tax=Nepenthes gracilis TaxID=150966 RepID=A0AAD3RXQ6_NEPGR|nr:hypothetical protein Nepgr_002338 [Nepenthes gracilis]
MSNRSIRSLHGRQHRSSDARMTPETLSRTPNSVYSAISTSRRSSSSRQSAVKVAAKSLAGVFIACFTPPENEATSSVSSDAQRRVNKNGCDPTRSVLVKSYNSTLERETGSIRFTLEQMYKATDNFSPARKIGQGGFGTVFKGTLDNGMLVAVKRAKKSVYDMNLGVEFQSEVQILEKVEHLNLVRFYGYLEEEDERILVVEYVPNGTLREHLDGIRGDILDLPARVDIAIDVAHAITYLHMYTDHPIIHRDIKSSNILLTENHRAKVADFGFARLAADTDSGATHVSTQVKGTAGYLDPEYLKTYQLTEKSDVYSFGILLVELVTGRRPIDTKRDPRERLTAKWAMRKFKNGDAGSAMDPRLERNATNSLILEKILELAFICIAPQRQSRPSMRRCAEILWSIRKDYKELSASDIDSISSLSERHNSITEE